ncbi:MAG: hypothetical protein K2K52_09130, partial [Paramuribaculum sp.]|nr:hypothetical protein [Paramuribaculum sp.]
GALILSAIIVYNCSNSGDNDKSVEIIDSISVSPGEIADVSKEDPLNLSVFVDLSDRITKEKDHMKQDDKDKIILKELAKKFFNKNEKKFNQSEDAFQIVFYPAPDGAQMLAGNLYLDLSRLNSTPEKRSALLNFQERLSVGVDSLYASALKAGEFLGSDIWGYFSIDKVKDLYKKGSRNVLIIITDGYIFDANNKIKDGKNYSYILPQTLSIPGSGLIPCKITHPDLEVYVIECNANPKTDFPKMQSVLEKWFKEMGIEKIDIQESDIPDNTLRHLDREIFDLYLK